MLVARQIGVIVGEMRANLFVLCLPVVAAVLLVQRQPGQREGEQAPRRSRCLGSVALGL